MEPRSGRYIDDENFILDDFEDLYEFVRNSEDYVLEFRHNRIALYNSGGRALEISRKENNYLLQFDFNNADILLNNNVDRLNEIVSVLKGLSFDVSDYEIWREERSKYNKLDEKGKHNAKTPNMDVKAYISNEDIKNYDFELLLNSISDIFKSYGDARRQELMHRTKLAKKCDPFQDGTIIFDSEYRVSFLSDPVKQELKMNQGGNVVNPDLVALKKVDDKYKIVFIELKTNLKSLTGSSNVIDHIEDYERYKEYYETDSTEREQLKKSVEFILDNKTKYKLLDGISSFSEIKTKIDYEEAPEFIIVCVFSYGEYINAGSIMKEKFKVTKRNIEWDNTIVFLDRDENYKLLEKSIFKEFIKNQECW